MATHQYTQFLEAEPGHFESGLNSKLAEAFQPECFARAAPSTNHKILPPANPLERAQRGLGRRGNRRQTRVPGVEGLAGWKRCPCPTGGQRRALASSDFFTEEHLEYFGWIPALRPG